MYGNIIKSTYSTPKCISAYINIKCIYKNILNYYAFKYYYKIQLIYLYAYIIMKYICYIIITAYNKLR